MEAALVVLDGWGLGDHDRLDAVRTAATPTVDRLRDAGAAGSLETWGERVGLPPGGMGNSEVGHLTIGAGRVVPQAHTRINAALEDGSFAENEVIESSLDHVEETGGRVHVLGLASDAGVHADLAHLEALIDLAVDRRVAVAVHAVTDGRDTGPTEAVGYLERLETAVARGAGASVATVTGRYYAMDRDANWERTRRAYRAVVDREAEQVAPSAVDAVEAAYRRGETDEFVEPTLVQGGPPVADGDAFVFANFRADRMRQLVGLLAGVGPDTPIDVDPPEVHVVTMTEYDERFDLPVAFPPRQPEHVLGEVLASAGLTQFRTAETEKYAHVTYFLNGGREVAFDGERREIVPSPDVPTYDLQPEMSAPRVTDTAIAVVEACDPDVLVLNYANPDMVGHTGDFEAAVDAVQAVDAQLARLLACLQAAGAHVLVTADHGNADDMGTPDNPHTAHTFNPVPFLYLSPDGDDGGCRIRADGGLADVAPTLLDLLDLEVPPVMSGTSLLVDR